MNPRALIRSLPLLGLLLGSLSALPVRAADTVVYYHTDALHSVTVVTNAQGQVIERTHYAPYGAVLNRPMRDGPGYGGHEEDAATGLVYMQARYYDPVAEQFTSADPVGVDPTSGGNFNRYAYANDNPYRYTDPDGRFIDTILDVAFIAYDVYTIATEGATKTNVAALGADSVAAVIPGVTGAGLAVRAAEHGAEVAKVTAKELRASGKADYAASKAKALAESGGKCVYCGKAATQGDHVKPLKSFAGDVNSGKLSKADAVKQAHAPENVVAACASCNGAAQKGAKELSATPGEGKWVPPKPLDKINEH